MKIRVPTRAASKKKEARGIYPMAKVVPGWDWNANEVNEGTSFTLHLGCSVVMTHCVADGLIGVVQKLQGSDGNNSVGKPIYDGATIAYTSYSSLLNIIIGTPTCGGIL